MSRFNQTLKQLQNQRDIERHHRVNRLGSLADRIPAPASPEPDPPLTQAGLRDESNAGRFHQALNRQTAGDDAGQPAGSPKPSEDLNRAHAYERPPQPPAAENATPGAVKEPPPNTGSAQPPPPARDTAVAGAPSHKRHGLLKIVAATALLLALLGTAAILATRIVRTETSPPPTHDIVIQGITLMKEKNVVLIDGEIYEAGDMVKGVRIVDISADNITVLDRGKTVVVEPPR